MEKKCETKISIKTFEKKKPETHDLEIKNDFLKQICLNLRKPNLKRKHSQIAFWESSINDTGHLW